MGCSDHYKINNNSVEHVSWNAGQGKVIKVIDGADPSTFVQLLEWYGKDRNAAYWKHIKIKNAEPTTFIPINNYYAVDANNAYVTERYIKGSDGGTFEYIGHNWSKDKSNYYYTGQPLDICDKTSFKIIPDEFPSRAIDDRCYYYQWNTVPVKNRNNLQVLPSEYAKDNLHVYWGNIIVKEADVSSFDVLKIGHYGLGKDKASCFSGPRVVKCTELNDEVKERCGCTK